MSVAAPVTSASRRAAPRFGPAQRIVRLILGRLAAGVGVMWGAATLTFIAMNATGGDMAIAILGGPDALPTAAALARVRKDYGLDQPLPVQYLEYLGRLAHGDLGESYQLRIPVATAIGEQVGPTVVLALCGAALALVIALVVAVMTARRPRLVRSAASTTELVVSSMPSFAIGILLLLAFSFRLHLFPVGGDHGWRSLVLPVVTLALPIAASHAQVLRQGLEDILDQPFILMARARGLSETAVRLGHALRHACIPFVTISGFTLTQMLGWVVITETLFARPGLGRLMVQATTSSDVPLVVGITLFVALLCVVINLVVDVLNALIDPRTVIR
jgi:peptide/nickel transport system permease protein